MDQTRLVEFDHPAYITGLPHRVRIPEADGSHVAVIMLHGRHGNEDATWVFSRTIPQTCLIVAPRGIVFDPFDPESEEAGYSWLLQPPGDWPSLEKFAAPSRALHDFIRALPDAYPVKPDQIYLLGFSQGAAVAYATAFNHPGLMRGIAGLVGFAPGVSTTRLADRPLNKLPVFMAIGVEDRRVPLEIARRGQETMKAAGADLTYNEYQVGHKLNGRGMRDLANWWQQRLKDSP